MTVVTGPNQRKTEAERNELLTFLVDWFVWESLTRYRRVPILATPRPARSQIGQHPNLGTRLRPLSEPGPD